MTVRLKIVQPLHLLGVDKIVNLYGAKPGDLRDLEDLIDRVAEKDSDCTDVIGNSREQSDCECGVDFADALGEDETDGVDAQAHREVDRVNVA